MKETESKTYMIVRMYDNPDKRGKVIKKGLTREEAMAHCSDPKTSTNGTKPFGQNWFDSFMEERATK